LLLLLLRSVVAEPFKRCCPQQHITIIIKNHLLSIGPTTFPTTAAVVAQPSQACTALTAAFEQCVTLQWQLQLALPHWATKHCAAPAAALPT
jgi:hypothetical protein